MKGFSPHNLELNIKGDINKPILELGIKQCDEDCTCEECQGKGGDKK